MLVQFITFLLSAGILQVESTDTTSVVTIPVSLRTHSGRYTITAKNKFGQKHVNVRVNVLGRFFFTQLTIYNLVQGYCNIIS